MKYTLTKKTTIKPTDNNYDFILDLCHRAKNLYNHTLYVCKHLNRLFYKQMKNRSIRTGLTHKRFYKPYKPIHNYNYKAYKLFKRQAQEQKQKKKSKQEQLNGDYTKKHNYKTYKLFKREIKKYNNHHNKHIRTFATKRIKDAYQNKSKQVIFYGWPDKYTVHDYIRDNFKNTIYDDYTEMLYAKSAQDLIYQCFDVWSSFVNAKKDYKKNPHKYKGQPKQPKYKQKDGYFTYTLSSSKSSKCIRWENGNLKLPKSMNNRIIPKIKKDLIDGEIKQIRFIPQSNYIEVLMIYETDVVPVIQSNNNYLSIDLGINNFATCTTNIGTNPFIIDGKYIKSINRFYNKSIAKLQEIAITVNNQYRTKRMNSITVNRNNQIKFFMHNASKYVIDYCLNNNISNIIIGKNKDWKQSCIQNNNNKKHRQNFLQIPFNQFIQMVQYKAKMKGINVILTEESYTSQTSYLDGEMPTKNFGNPSRRGGKHNKDFRSNTGILINADVNGSYQIMHKVLKQNMMEKLPYQNIKRVNPCVVYNKQIKTNKVK